MATPKYVLISGASTGIGLHAAQYLADREFHVYAGVRNDSDFERVGTLHERIHPVRMDVTRKEDIRLFAQTIGEADVAGLFGLINNAGISVAGPLEFIPEDDLRRQFEINLFGAFALTQALVPHLRKTRGRIINMSSISGRFAGPLMGPYAMSKFALEAFSDSLRRELSPWGIDVSVVEPGAIDTPIWKKSVDEARRRMQSMPEKGHELYGKAIQTISERARETARDAIPTEAVSRVVHHALTAPRPKTRYLVGPDAKMLARLVRWLPERWLDRVVAKKLGL